jgi:hypothetical protein
MLVAAYVLLCLGGMLEVAGVGFRGLDLLIGACFFLAIIAGAGSYLFGSSPRLGLLGSGLGVAALVFHIWLNLA